MISSRAHNSIDNNGQKDEGQMCSVLIYYLTHIVIYVLIKRMEINSDNHHRWEENKRKKERKTECICVKVSTATAANWKRNPK